MTTTNAKLEAWLTRQRVADAEEALSWLLNELQDLAAAGEIYVNLKEAERQAEVIRDVLSEMGRP